MSSFDVDKLSFGGLSEVKSWADEGDEELPGFVKADVNETEREWPSKPPYSAFVGGIAPATLSDHIFRFFGELNVIDVVMHEPAKRNQSPQWAYAFFKTLDDLKKAIDKNGQDLLGRTVSVDVGKNMELPDRKKGRKSSSGDRSSKRRVQQRDFTAFSSSRSEKTSGGNETNSRRPFVRPSQRSSPGNARGNHRQLNTSGENGGVRRKFQRRDRSSSWNKKKHGDNGDGGDRKISPPLSPGSNGEKKTPAYRPRLKLLPRSKPVETGTRQEDAAKNNSIFGGGKARNGVEWEKTHTESTSVSETQRRYSGQRRKDRRKDAEDGGRKTSEETGGFVTVKSKKKNNNKSTGRRTSQRERSESRGFKSKSRAASEDGNIDRRKSAPKKSSAVRRKKVEKNEKFANNFSALSLYSSSDEEDEE